MALSFQVVYIPRKMISSTRWRQVFAFVVMHCNLNCALFLCDSRGIHPLRLSVSVHNWQASHAACMARSQYSWCLPFVVANSSKLHSSRNLSSYVSPFGPNANWCSITFSKSSLWAEMSVPVFGSCPRTHSQIHWACVTCRSWVISPVIHNDAGWKELLCRRYVLWILAICLECRFPGIPDWRRQTGTLRNHQRSDQEKQHWSHPR